VKAAVLYGQEDVRVEEIPALPLRPGEVRVSIQAALTCGTDVKVFRRGYHARMIVPPAVFGHEFAGVLSEVAPDVTEWQVGERVVAANSAPCGECYCCRHGQENLCDDLLFLNGAYAESIVIPARLVQKNLYRLSAGTAFADAALVEPLACVVQGVNDMQLLAEEEVLILGAGPIGLMFTALARQRNCQVTVVGRGEERLEAALRLGAKRVLEAPEGPQLVQAIRSQTGVFDVVIEAVGRPEAWSAALEVVRKGGRVNWFGGCPRGSVVSLDATLMHYHGLTLRASFHHTPRAVRAALDLIERDMVRGADFISSECPLSALPGLLRSLSASSRSLKTLVRLDQ
jgi:L-iditol 2-dehydrogenase